MLFVGCVRLRLGYYITAFALAAAPVSGFAQAITNPTKLPGAADVQRIDKREETPMPPSDLQPTARPLNVMPATAAPEQSKKVYFRLRAVDIENMHAFTNAEIRDTYADYLDKEISLDIAWLIAAKISERYQAAGYFLSRAYVPQQQIGKDGVLHIKVIEGYIAEVKLDDGLKDNALVNHWIERLKGRKPITSDYLESVLLQINDIPGVGAHATLEPVKQGSYEDGAVRLLLTHEATTGHGSFGFDNDGSKYLGPYEASAAYQASIIPNELTSVHFLNTIPWHEMQYGTIDQHIAIAPAWFVDVYGGVTEAFPGYTLKTSDIKSNSVSLGASLSYQVIRQRQENLLTKLTFETRDTHSDILELAPLTRDRIRVLRAGLTYEKVDAWQGYDQLSFTFSQGLGIMDASQAGDPHLSRAEATPDFRKAEFTFSRSQALDADWGVVTAASGQIASGPLYSSEEFGYGGQAFGRAFDSSELVGDHGIDASVEFRYLSLDTSHLGFDTTPYTFYDGGMVFNNDRTQEKTQMGTSAGLGFRLNTDFGAGANLGVAFPIGQAISTPIYGGAHDPRYTMEFSYGF